MNTLKSTKTNSNITIKEKDTINDLLNNHNDKVFLPSDKGGEFCVIYKEEYNKLAFDHLSDTEHYMKIVTKIKVKDIEDNINKTWINICKLHQLPNSFIKSYISRNTKLANFYILIKTHKEGRKVRPIVSSINSPTYKISWLLSNLLKPILKHIPAHIESSKELMVNSMSTIILVG